MATTDEEGVDVLNTSTGEKVKAGAAAETEYVLLQRDDSGLWKAGPTTTARSAEAAIRSIGKEGTYVAIPSRSFKPVTVKAEVVTTLKLEDAV